MLKITMMLGSFDRLLGNVEHGPGDRCREDR